MSYDLNKEYNNFINNITKNINKINYIDNNYSKSYIHTSPEPLTKKKLKNNLIDNITFGYQSVYENPVGIWLSTGSDWLKWSLMTNHSKWLDNPYVYEITLKKKNKILFIKNVKELINFDKKYCKYDYKTRIDWKKVKKDYDGLSINPYLGGKIWGINKDPTEEYIEKRIQKYIKKSLNKNFSKYPKLFLEWYRHWEIASVVIWKVKAIDKIKKINIS